MFIYFSQISDDDYHTIIVYCRAASQKDDVPKQGASGQNSTINTIPSLKW